MSALIDQYLEFSMVHCFICDELDTVTSDIKSRLLVVTCTWRRAKSKYYLNKRVRYEFLLFTFHIEDHFWLEPFTKDRDKLDQVKILCGPALGVE